MKKKALLLMLVLVFISTNALAQNTIYGTVTGDIQEGVIVSLYRLTCGQYILEDTITTDSAGYYAFSDLYHRLHRVIPENTDYSFAPESVDVQILQTVITSHDFTATSTP